MKREKTEDRQSKLDDGMMYDGFEFKGRKHKPLTGAALKFLQMIGSPLGNKASFEDYSDLDLTLEYLFATSATPQELSKASKEWDVMQFEFANEYTVKDLGNSIIAESLVRDMRNQAAATFELVGEEESKKE